MQQVSDSLIVAELLKTKQMSLNIDQINLYISALIENAENLIFEAEILYRAKAFPRAYALAHLSIEELSKCIILYVAGRKVQLGSEVDWKKIMRRLRDHKSKLRQDIIEDSLWAGAFGGNEIFEAMINNADNLVNLRNDQKNSSLYVGIDKNGKIVSPATKINKIQADKTIKKAKMKLECEQLAYSFCPLSQKVNE